MGCSTVRYKTHIGLANFLFCNRRENSLVTNDYSRVVFTLLMNGHLVILQDPPWWVVKNGLLTPGKRHDMAVGGYERCSIFGLRQN